MSWARMSALAVDREHASAVHDRWAETHISERFEQGWIPDQCGGCQFYVCLEGKLGSDWGACTNPASPHDGKLMFEHDGCEHYDDKADVLTPALVACARAEVRLAHSRWQDTREEAEKAGLKVDECPD